MAMVVKNNMTAKQTLNRLDKNSKALSKSLKKVASGMKLNSAADDASGFSISEKMRGADQGTGPGKCQCSECRQPVTDGRGGGILDS